MNGLLFLLPFILVVSVGIYQDSFAENTIVGYNYFDTTNPDGSHTWSQHYPYVFDGNNWVSFIQNGNEIQTAHGNVRINTDGSFTITDKGITDRIITKYADVSNLNSWTYLDSLNNDTPDISWDGTQFVSSKVKAGIGQLDYKYINSGNWKTQLEATNLSSLTTKAFGFDEIFDIESDTIKFGGITRNLDNFNNTTFDKTFLDNNKAKVLDLLNGFNFDFDIAYDNLYSITVYDTGVNKSRLVFDYRTSIPLLPGETLILDPTYSSSSTTVDGHIQDDSNNNICDTAGTLTNDGAGTGMTGARFATSDATDCTRAYMEWDISSIPTSSTVTDSVFKFDIQGLVGTPDNCVITGMTVRPSTDTNANIFNGVGSGTTLATTSECVTTGDNKSVDLGSTGDTYIQSRISSGWAALGIKSSNEVLDANYHIGQIGTNEDGTATPKPTLEITYTTGSPPNPVTSVWVSNINANSLKLNWSPPTSFGSGTFQTYTVNSTTPWGAPLTFNQNSTVLNANITGLTFGTDYSFRIAAATEIAYNTTGSYILNTTTTTNTYDVPPTLSKVFPNSYTSTTQLNLEWAAGSMTNVNGYRIARESPVGGGFSNIVSNSTNTNTYYNNTGLSTNTYYNYKVYSMNQSGISTASNTYVMTTYHLPDAITDLVATATDLITVVLSWTQPTLYGTLNGYQINYTTPYGNPTTVITNSTGSSDVTYEITGLSGGSDYSFRVAPVTFHGTNATGNIANATAFQNFEIGSIEFPTGENPDELFEITFENYEHNSTATDVQVVYDSSVDLICDFSFVNGNTNQTYSGLTENAISGSSVYSNFTLQNPNNEIIDIYCYDSLDELNNARHRLTNTVYSDIPIINQILGFQSGDYGTTGMFGAIDLITLLIVIISIIGFNRVNPAVGVIFMFMMLGIMAWFELIVVPTAILGIIILIITLAIASVKKA